MGRSIFTEQTFNISAAEDLNRAKEVVRSRNSFASYALKKAAIAMRAQNNVFCHSGGVSVIKAFSKSHVAILRLGLAASLQPTPYIYPQMLAVYTQKRSFCQHFCMYDARIKR